MASAPATAYNFGASAAMRAAPRIKRHVRVCVRVRPLMHHEVSKGDNVVIRCPPDDRTLQTIISKVGDKETVRQYEFDRVCGPEKQQSEFFEASGMKTLIDSALEGINVSIFAYGQTGSGKTFSMSGHEEHLIARSFDARDMAAGLIPRAVDYLYGCMREQPADMRTVVRASFCEIYNEMIYDLLNLTGESLPLRWNAGQGFFVQGQLVVQCDTIDDVLAVVTEGHKNRTVGSHALNVDSSRSHSLLSLLIERTYTDPTAGDTVTHRSKVIFVDLAGSERLKESKSEGLSAIETRQINKSLFVLGKVIAALADKRNQAPTVAGTPHGRASPMVQGGGPPGRTSLAQSGALPVSAAGGRVSSPSARNGGASRNQGSWDADGPTDPHIPYRDSKLTKLLMDSLGGSALTIMIACVSPASSFIDETLNTLQYAMRASKIENAPVLQIDTKDAMIVALRRENKMLRQEIDVFRAYLGLPPEMSLEEAVSLLRAQPPAPTYAPYHQHPPHHPAAPPAGTELRISSYAGAPEETRRRPPIPTQAAGGTARRQTAASTSSPTSGPASPSKSAMSTQQPGGLGHAAGAAAQRGRYRRTFSGRVLIAGDGTDEEGPVYGTETHRTDGTGQPASAVTVMQPAATQRFMAENTATLAAAPRMSPTSDDPSFAELPAVRDVNPASDAPPPQSAASRGSLPPARGGYAGRGGYNRPSLLAAGAPKAFSPSSNLASAGAALFRADNKPRTPVAAAAEAITLAPQGRTTVMNPAPVAAV